MKWKVCLKDRHVAKEVFASDPFDLEEAVKTVEILMKPSLFGNESWEISMKPVKERGDKNV